MNDLASPACQPRVFAVIDIGATSVRMMIAQVHPDGTVSHLENLSQAVQLGRDSFVNGKIRRSTIEDCVHVLKIYRRKLVEYEIDDPEQVRVVATSAVREASNRLAFLDRIYIGTGFDIEPFDESQLHRVTWLGIKPLLDHHPDLARDQLVVCEVGGGSTETLILVDGDVSLAQTWRLGALRLIHSLDPGEPWTPESRHLMESRIARTADQIVSMIERSQPARLLMMGSEMRLAASRILGRPAGSLERVPADELHRITDEVLATSPDSLVTRFQLGIQEAESLGPALLVNSLIARRLGVNEIFVADVNLRDGLVKEMIAGRQWIGNTEDQVIGSVTGYARKFGVDLAHAQHVSTLALELFRQTSELHQLPRRWETSLRIAALLHESGMAINERSYHKHSMYIIRNTVFFGVSAHELDLIALIARYHRRAFPQRSHEIYSRLDQDERVAVSKLAALLRVAKALDVARNQTIQDIHCAVRGNILRIEVTGTPDLSLAQLELREQQELFEYVFGLAVELTRGSTASAGTLTP